MGNNATHELDIARWALDVHVPYRVDVQAAKTNFPDDGWSMYDSMEATYLFEDNKVIKWDGQSRNGYSTYGTGRGTIVYGTEGTVFMDRGGYKIYDRGGKLVKDSKSESNESGTALGGGGDMSTRHAVNFFETIRGKETLTSPIDIGATSQIMTHYANIAYRINEGFNVNTETRKMENEKAMKLWSREYENGWKPSA
jgi:predicted dehydrogenase